MLLSAVMCAKPLCHRNVNIKLYINQIYANTIIHREFTLRNRQENDTQKTSNEVFQTSRFEKNTGK